MRHVTDPARLVKPGPPRPPRCPNCGSRFWRIAGKLVCPDCTRYTINAPRGA